MIVEILGTKTSREIKEIKEMYKSCKNFFSVVIMSLKLCGFFFVSIPWCDLAV